MTSDIPPIPTEGPTAAPTEKPIERVPEAGGPDAFQIYQLMWERRQHYEQMLWQTPALIFTAQAFLLTIALASDTQPTGRTIAALLLVLSSVASSLLFQKHRALEVKTSKWLERKEMTWTGTPHPQLRVHGRSGHARRRPGEPCVLGLSMAVAWTAFLWLTVAFSLVILGFSLFSPHAMAR